MRGERPPQYLKSALECAAACLVRVLTRARHLTVLPVYVLGEQRYTRVSEERERERGEGEGRKCVLPEVWRGLR